MNMVFWLSRQRLLALCILASLIPVLHVSGAGCLSAPPGLVGWWPGDGSASDIAGTNNGALQGGATASAAGLAGSAFAFDGTNGYVQIPDAAALRPTNLTVEVWVLFSALDSAGLGGSPAGQQYILFKQNTRNSYFEGYNLSKNRTAGGDVLEFLVSSALGELIQLQSTTHVATGIWYHVAGVRGSNSVQLYVNGQLETQTNISFAQDYGSFPLYFGTTGESYWDHKLRGLLDEVSLYNRALTSGEIAAVYAAGAAGKCKGAGITAAPQGQTVMVGTNALFTVTATGYGSLNYQWQFNGARIAGATDPSLTLTNVQATNAGSYTVVVTNALGVATSAVAVLTVLVPPALSALPQNLVATNGAAALFSITASGTAPLSYQWRRNGTPITDATAPSYSLASATTNDAASYDVVVTNVAGAVTSSVETLVVYVPPWFTSQPADWTVSIGDSVILSAGALGVPTPALQWFFGTNLLTGETSPALALTNISPEQAGGYYCVAANAAGTTASRVAALTVYLVPVITTQPQSRTNVAGTTAAFDAVASGVAPLSYQWQYNGFSLVNDARITGATSNSLRITATQPADAGSYTLIVTNPAGAVTSVVATLTVIVPPTITVPPASLSMPVGTNAGFSVTAGGTLPLSYQWRYNSTSIAGATNESLSLNNIQATNAGSYTVVVTNVAGSATSAAAVLTVLGPPMITTQPAGLDAVAGTNATFRVMAAGTPPLGYQWQFNGSDLGGATGTDLMLSNIQSTNTGSYTVVITNPEGSATSAVAVLTVLLPPVIQVPPASLSASAGTNASFTVTASGAPPLGYQWRFNGVDLANATGTSLLLANIQLTNAGSYTVQVTNAVGTATSAVAVLTVIAPPAISGQPASLNVAAGANLNFSVTAAGTPPLSYQWQFNGADVWNGTGASLVLTNAQPGNSGSYRVIVTNVAGSTTSLVATLTVNLVAACTPPVSGLVGWWSGDGSANDTAGTNNGALLGGATATAAGMVGSTFSFDGTNGYAQVPDSADLRPTNLTIEAWVRFSSLDSQASGGSPAGEQYIVFKQNASSVNFEGYALTKTRVAGRDLLDFQVSSAASQSAEIASTSAVVTGVWYHVAAVRGSNSLQLYVNGHLESQTNVSFAQSYGSYPLYFGSSGQAAWDHKFAGALDEVSLYNRALSSNEVAAIYAAGANGKCRAVTITAQPQDRTVVVGANASFSAAASGSVPLSYQWQRDGVNLVNNSSVSGAYSSALTLANVSFSDAANYRVIIADVVGAATSAVAVLEVVSTLALPTITNQPASQAVTAGTNAIFTVAALGSGSLGYQWQFNGTNLTDNGQVSGTTSPTLAINYVVPGNSGGYTVVVTNLVGAVTSVVATLTVNPPTGCLSAPAGLVGWWPGDGSVRDLVGTNHGILQGNAVANADGYNGQAFKFDGTNGYVQIPDSPTFHPTNLSVECWVRFDTYQVPGNTYYSNQQYIVFKQNSQVGEFEGFGLTKDHDPQGDVFLWEVASPKGELIRIDSVSTVVTGVWYHVVGVRGPDYVQLYKDGQLEVQTNVTFQQDYGNFPLYFGTSGQSYYDRRMHGELDEVALYNRALSAPEIAALYAAGAAGKCKGTNGVLITSQPQGQALNAGSNVVLSVAAAGIAPLSYQWQFNGVAIAGATGTNLPLANLQPTNSGVYKVVVSNPAGSAISVAATLTVLVPPAITLQPVSETLLAGGTASFSAAASGTAPLSYQWQLNGTNLDGATNQPLTLTNVQPFQAGKYSVLVTNSAGWATSEVATLTVLVPPDITLQPSNETVLAGGTANFSVTATGTAPMAYQWQFNGANLNGDSAGWLILTNVQAAQAGSYNIIVTNIAGSATSAVAVLTVVGPPTLVNPRTTAEGGFAFTISGAAGLSYVIEVTTNLHDWVPLTSGSNATGLVEVIDASSSNSVSRFYRALLSY